VIDVPRDGVGVDRRCDVYWESYRRCLSWLFVRVVLYGWGGWFWVLLYLMLCNFPELLLLCVVMGVVLRRCWVWFVGSVPLGAVRGFIEVVGVASGGVLSLYPGGVG
jgi:hypothetical protein